MSRMPVRLLGLWLSAALALGGCAPGTLNRNEMLNPSWWREADSDIARTFDFALVLLPGIRGAPPLVARMNEPALADYLDSLDPLPAYPTVLYMHGCAGIGDIGPLRTLAEHGFAVIAPDSFARRFRPLQCSPSRRTGGKNLFVFDFRMVEISYALYRMDALPWVDGGRLFLVGTSEGGLAAAQYRGADFRARVIAQWTCHGAPLVRGLAAPEDEPVLAVVRANDPWYAPTRTNGQDGDCGAFMAGRPNSESIVVTAGRRHNIYNAPGIMERIVAFLNAAL